MTAETGTEIIIIRRSCREFAKEAARERSGGWVQKRTCSEWCERSTVQTQAVRRRGEEGSVRVHPLPLHSLYCRCITRKCMTFKMKVNVIEHNIRNDAIRWQISKSLNEIRPKYFYHLSPFLRHSYFKYSTLKIEVNVVEYNTRNDANRWK